MPKFPQTHAELAEYADSLAKDIRYMVLSTLSHF
jgi:hypothetical protein